MGILDLFTGRNKQFVSATSFESNLANQLKMTPQTLTQLAQYGVTPESELKLEFFFYTNQAEKASALAGALATKQYEVAFRPSASERNVQVITGWTTAMPMDESSVRAWTEQMCRVGVEHDCEFDGWGTSPEQ